MNVGFSHVVGRVADVVSTLVWSAPKLLAVLAVTVGFAVAAVGVRAVVLSGGSPMPPAALASYHGELSTALDADPELLALVVPPSGARVHTELDGGLLSSQVTMTDADVCWGFDVLVDRGWLVSGAGVSAVTAPRLLPSERCS